MFSLSNLPQYCLAAMTMGCLGLASVPASHQLQHADVPPPDPGHRGSGRVVGQVPVTLEQRSLYQYRGTGRVPQGNPKPVAHRGSGRVSPDGTQPPTISYRGSGRVVPDPVQATEWA